MSKFKIFADPKCLDFPLDTYKTWECLVAPPQKKMSINVKEMKGKDENKTKTESKKLTKMTMSFTNESKLMSF